MRDNAPAWTIAGVILLVKSFFGGWAAVVALSTTRLHHRSFFNATLTRRHTGVGVVLIVFAVATVVVAIGLFLRSGWARIATYVLEGLAIVLALNRVGSAAGLAFVSIAISVAVIALVYVGSERTVAVDT